MRSRKNRSLLFAQVNEWKNLLTHWMCHAIDPKRITLWIKLLESFGFCLRRLTISSRQKNVKICVNLKSIRFEWKAISQFRLRRKGERVRVTWKTLRLIFVGLTNHENWIGMTKIAHSGVNCCWGWLEAFLAAPRSDDYAEKSWK